jgi:hypothetical protein
MSYESSNPDSDIIEMPSHTTSIWVHDKDFENRAVEINNNSDFGFKSCYQSLCSVFGTDNPYGDEQDHDAQVQEASSIETGGSTKGAMEI